MLALLLHVIMAEAHGGQAAVLPRITKSCDSFPGHAEVSGQGEKEVLCDGSRIMLSSQLLNSSSHTLHVKFVVAAWGRQLFSSGKHLWQELLKPAENLRHGQVLRTRNASAHNSPCD